MTEKQKLIVIQRFLKGISLKKISRSTKLSTNEVKLILQDRAFLKKQFGEDSKKVISLIHRKSRNIALAQKIVKLKTSNFQFSAFTYAEQEALSNLEAGELEHDCPIELRTKLREALGIKPVPISKIGKENFRKMLEQEYNRTLKEQRYTLSTTLKNEVQKVKS